MEIFYYNECFRKITDAMSGDKKEIQGESVLESKQKLFNYIIIFLCEVFVFLSALFCLSMRWVFFTWNNLTMDELVFHLNTPLEGTNEGMVMEYIIYALLPSIVILIVISIIIYLIQYKKIYHRFIVMCLLISISLIGVMGKYTWDNLKIGQYIHSQNTESTFIEDYYVNPDNVSIEFPDKKRNLIYIFLESMETTYSDLANGGGYDIDIIPELTSLAQSNEDFSGNSTSLNGAYVPVGTTWTMGAMFAQTSGLPLKVSIDGNDMDTQTSFFSGVNTIGNILENEGYSQTLLIGSDATFGGRRLYFTEHGHYEMFDYEYAKENKLIPKNYKVWWGYEDKKLFDFAKEKLLDFSKKDEPFNLTMLTVDTHFEDGYICDDCTDSFNDNQYANVISCSSKKVVEFISWLQEQEFYKDTTIVLAGDHLTMDKDFCENIDSGYERKAFTTIINSASVAQKEDSRKYTTLDLFPTTLAAMGVDIEGNQLGLGTNLFSKTATLVERFGIEKLNQELSRNSDFLDELSNINTENEDLLQRNESRKPNIKVKISEIENSDGMYTITVSNLPDIEETVSGVYLVIQTDEKGSESYSFDLNLLESKKSIFSTDCNLNELISNNEILYARPIVVGSSGKEYECRLKKLNIN